MDRLTMIAELIGPQFQEKVSTTLKNWLTAAHLKGSKEQDYDKYARKMKKYLKWELIILDDFLHTITDECEIKIGARILFELLEKRNEQRKSTIVCSQRDLVLVGRQTLSRSTLDKWWSIN